MKRDLGVMVIGHCASNMIALFFSCLNGDCSDNFENCVWWTRYVLSGRAYVEKYTMMTQRELDWTSELCVIV